MSDQDNADDKLAARQQRMKGVSKSSSPLLMFLFFGLIAIAALFLIFPDQVGHYLGFDTSESESIQQTSQTDSIGLNTNLRPKRRIETGQEPNIVIQPVENKNPEVPPPLDRSAELESQITALQEQIQQLLNRPETALVTESGISAKALQAALEEQSKRDRETAKQREALLRAELQAELAALRTSATPQIPTRPDAAEEERLRKLKELEARRAAREAELRERLLSDGNIYDESKEGAVSGAGSSAAGIQEISSNEQFLNRNANAEVNTARARDLHDLSRTVVQGTIITAVLETAVNTELPGSMRALVSLPVYSYDGQEILMPAGTRLIGSYNSDISLAQSRVLIAWNRAVTPEGKSISLAATGIDRLGRGGVEGNVDSRFAERFGAAALITTISSIPTFIAAAATDDSESGEASADLASDVSEDFSDQTESVLEEYLSLPPIIRLPQGQEVKIFVNQDLIF